MPKYSFRRGAGLGNRPIDDHETHTLEHVEYNKETNRVEANRSVKSTLESFYLGNHHKMSSGGENVFFTNLSSDINFYPMWGGIKDQSIVANQDSSGLIQPAGRIYTTDLEFVEGDGPPALLGSVEYHNSFTVGVDHQSVHGNTVIVEETILATDFLYYNVWFGIDDSGHKLYEQKLTGRAYSPGDLFEWSFNNPLEVLTGTPIHVEMLISSTEDGIRRVLLVRQSLGAGLLHYFKVAVRAFIDRDLAFAEDECNYEWTASEFATPHAIHSADNCIIVNDQDEYIYWHNPLGTLSLEERLCNYEWAVREDASPNSIHLEDNCIVLNEQDEYVEWSMTPFPP